MTDKLVDLSLAFKPKKYGVYNCDKCGRFSKVIDFEGPGMTGDDYYVTLICKEHGKRKFGL